MDASEVLLNAALSLINTNQELNLDEAKDIIKKTTGFLSPETRDSSYTRLRWDEYFMSLAFLVSMRSPDSQTQHGCVIVDKNNRVISTGYNGWVHGANDESMPNLRPKKYLHVIHSEVNAVLSAYQNLSGCTAYITGAPCNECLKVMAQSGIKDIVIGDRSHVFATEYIELQSFICASHDIKIRKFIGKLATLDGREITQESHK